MDQQMLLKIISVGDSQTGKSCLIKRYCEGKFINKYVTTIGVDYGVKKMNIGNRRVAVYNQLLWRINFFDLSGDDDYKEIRNPFFADAQGVLLVCDITDKSTFQNIQKWEKIMIENGLELDKACVFLVANKCDMKQREFEPSELLQYARKKNYDAYVCSASSGDNVNEVLIYLQFKIKTKIFEKMFTKIVDSVELNRQKLTK